MRAVKIWLWTGVIMVLVQVALGGITRLTESGLSITEWDVLMGSMPPMNAGQWDAEFEHYKSSAQFEKVNSDFTVEQFKHIYWWEYIHRLWARLIGFVFLIPFIVFLLQKKLARDLKWKLVLVLFLGGLQGFVGWVMVASGLDGDPWVDPSKLTIHLLLALLVYIYLLWLVFSIGDHSKTADHPATHKATKWVFGLVLFQIALGGLMAGTDAGMVYKTWPLMSGRFIPEGAFTHLGSADKLVQLTTEINFLHRTVGLVVALLILRFWWVNRNRTSARMQQIANMLVVLVLVQVALGVLTLTIGNSAIPIFWGVCHQLTACILLGFATAAMYFSKQRTNI
ncbi:MAG: COX15/CtaA family protein [Chitinophagales bacterium]